MLASIKNINQIRQVFGLRLVLALMVFASNPTGLRMKNLKSVFSLLSFFLVLQFTQPVLVDEERLVPATLEELRTAVADLIREKDVPAVGIACIFTNTL